MKATLPNGTILETTVPSEIALLASRLIGASPDSSSPAASSDPSQRAAAKQAAGASSEPPAASPRNPNQQISIGPPRIKRLPSAGTIGAAIMLAIPPGTYMTTEQIQNHLKPNHLSQSVQAEISALHRKGLIGENSKVGKKVVWGRI